MSPACRGSLQTRHDRARFTSATFGCHRAMHDEACPLSRTNPAGGKSWRAQVLGLRVPFVCRCGARRTARFTTTMCQSPRASRSWHSCMAATFATCRHGFSMDTRSRQRRSSERLTMSSEGRARASRRSSNSLRRTCWPTRTRRTRRRCWRASVAPRRTSNGWPTRTAARRRPPDRSSSGRRAREITSHDPDRDEHASQEYAGRPQAHLTDPQRQRAPAVRHAEARAADGLVRVAA